MGGINQAEIRSVLEQWQHHWPEAKKVWSAFIKLREPQWCLSSDDAKQEGLTGSFAMIRLTDHRIVIDLEKVVTYGVSQYAMQVLAHEIGHHIYTPANLRDNAVLLGRIRWALADMDKKAGFVANIYEDLIINDILHRSRKLDMAAVYKQLNKGVPFSAIWTLIMRTYEYLWRLKKGELATDSSLHSDRIDADASVMASLIRSYAKRWINGGGRFAALMYPYLLEEEEFNKAMRSLQRYLDTQNAGEGGGLVAGLAEVDEEAINGAIDPRTESTDGPGQGNGQDASGRPSQTGEGPRQRYLSPGVYIDLGRQVNPKATQQDLAIQYYREIALPHLIRFPVDHVISTDLLIPEGTDVWESGDPLEEIDWLESAIASPQITPGFTTRKRIFGEEQDSNKKLNPLDVYIGVDCSGSMRNPMQNFSWPVLAATIIGMSALRAGAKVMGCLSGEPGSFMETEGYVTREKDLLTVLTSYLGTGYAYGIARLKKPFGEPLKKKSHLIIVTDDDIFHMLGSQSEDDTWGIIEYALKNAGGTGTIVLHSQPAWHREEVRRLQAMGWHIHYVTDESTLLDFAAEFSRKNYHKPTKR